MSLGISLIVIFFLLALSASFSSLETALFSLKPLERYRLKEAGGISSLISRILEKPRELLTTVLFGNELVNVAISILAGSIAYHLFGDYEGRSVYLLSTMVITVVLLLFGEIIPKNIAIRSPLITSQVLILPYQLVAWLAWPFRILFTKIADWIVSLFGADPRSGRRLIVEEELRSLLELGKKEGTLADLERTLLSNALDFSTLKVSQVMAPRKKIVSASLKTSIVELLKIFEKYRYSRIPIYDGNLDQILGILHAKDLLPFRLQHPGEDLPLTEILKPFAEAGQEETLDQLFREFQSRRIHMGIVKDASGKVIGLVTMDDLLRRFFP